MIETFSDTLLEGDHDFSVIFDGASPDGAVIFDIENFTVTITDSSDGELIQPLS